MDCNSGDSKIEAGVKGKEGEERLERKRIC